MPVPNLKRVCAEAINILERDGWYQGGPIGPDGEVCLFTAIRQAYVELTGLDCFVPTNTLFILDRACGEQAPDWNDAPERSYADVIGLLAGLAGVEVEAAPERERIAA